MKFHEAIDMIMDGGEAYMKKSIEELRFTFNQSVLVLADKVGDTWIKAASLSKDMLGATDWIVEKDGVVYGEKPTHYCREHQIVLYSLSLPPKPIWLFCTVCGKEDRIHEQDERAELEDKHQSWEEIKMPPLNEKYKIDYEDVLKATIAQMQIRIEMLDKLISLQDKLEGDWLEKKMLCFVRRYNSDHGPYDKVTCCESECPFCFSPERPKNDHIPDASKMAENDHSEDVREKVTVEFVDYISLLDDIHALEEAAFKAGENGAKECEAKDIKIYKGLKKKLEYLVSLQEKK